MLHEDIQVFEGKNFAELLRDIYNNTTKRKNQIYVLVGELSKLINKAQDAQIIVPIIKEYLDIDVKSDEHLVKMAGVVQRLASSTTTGGNQEGGMLTEKEKEQLLSMVDEEENLSNEIEEIKKMTESMTTEEKEANGISE